MTRVMDESTTACLWGLNKDFRALAAIATNPLFSAALEMRIQLLPVAVGLTGVLILAGAPLSFAGQHPLTGAEITQYFSGARIYGRTQQADYQVDYKPNGEMIGANANGGDKGRWWVKGNTLCRKWHRWLGGKEACFQIIIKGDTALWRVAGRKTILDTTSVPKK
jgi:hypothetical protein